MRFCLFLNKKFFDLSRKAGTYIEEVSGESPTMRHFVGCDTNDRWMLVVEFWILLLHIELFLGREFLGMRDLKSGLVRFVWMSRFF